MAIRSVRILFVLSAVALSVAMFANLHSLPFPFTQMDEQAHMSYGRTLVVQQHWWPDFNDFPMRDAADAPRAERNYLNHPPTFYWLAKLTPGLRGDAMRILPALIGILGFLLYMRIGARLALPLLPSVCYAALPILFALYNHAGFFSNDGVALLGGMLAVQGSLAWLRASDARRAGGLMLAGIALASVKLTALLLVGCYVLAILLQHRRPVSRATCILAALGLLAIAAPYLYLWHLTGSPAPMTLGQQDMLRSNATQWGWIDAPRMDFLSWLATFLRNFADQYAGPEITLLPLLAVLASLVVLSRHRAAPMAPVARAAGAATLVTLVLHAAYSWPRYQEYGWMLDTFIRYYFPLLAAYGAVFATACMRLLQRVDGAHHGTER